LKLNDRAYSDEDLFKVVTIIQDIGSGKTHLTLHMRTIPEIDDKAIICYVDLAQVHPREIDTIFSSIIKGFDSGYFKAIFEKFVGYLEHKYSESPKLVKKVIKYGFFDTLNGNPIESKLKQLLEKKNQPSFTHLFQLLSHDFSKAEIQIIFEIIKKGTLNYSDLKTFDNLMLILTSISSINYKFFNKITIFQIDEFDANKQSLDYIKGLINCHIQYSVLMLITTPSYYSDISRVSPSLFDRLEKANYKIDLAGSNSFDEINDIVLEYIKQNTTDLNDVDKNDLSSKIKIIYDEFPDFRNIRSVLNILYHSTDISSKKNSYDIDEQSIEESIKNIYPGLRLRGSIMGIPISEFIKMRKLSIDKNNLETGIKNAVKNLIDYVDELGTVKKSDGGSQEGILDAVYSDQLGKKIGVTIAIDSDKNKNFDKIVKSSKRNLLVDKLIILTTNITNVKNNDTTFVTVDRWKLVDLLYFSKKYADNEIKLEDPQKAILLAKSIQLF
ncbi:MAG: hypothetical protein M3Z01_04100, partial [Thermoproteota archaeon]|nr:hypothetical protein [Thermoproteota archaeon]